MATIAEPSTDKDIGGFTPRSPFTRTLDRWIYVFMASWFMLITLVGFVPFTIERIAANRAGTKPPFPSILHLHAVVMSIFLLLLLTQAILMATGRSDRHQWLGRAAILIVPAMVVVMIILVPASYHVTEKFAQTAPPAIREKLLKGLAHDNTLLLEIREIILFPLLMFIALQARRSDTGLHKRLMFLATAVLLIAALNRMPWLPRSSAHLLLTGDLYLLLIVSPMLVWDLIRTRSIPRAYFIWAGLFAVASIPVYALWGTQLWFSTVPTLMRI